MQPTFLPWAGFFRLIGRSNVFVFLDDAQYERGTWHQRNRILINGQVRWITVPVRRDNLGQSILEVSVDDLGSWRKRHLEMVRHAYGKHLYYADVAWALEPINDISLTSLADLNIALIMKFCSGLKLDGIKYIRSGSLGISGIRTERLVAICKGLGAKGYLSPRGAATYLAEDRLFESTSIKLDFDDFFPAHYSQPLVADFVSHLSILDVVANLGWHGAKSYLSLEEQ
jgi:hypothetical protein